MLSKSENNLSKIPVNLVTPPGGLAILSNSERGGASESLADWLTFSIIHFCNHNYFQICQLILQLLIVLVEPTCKRDPFI